MTPLTKNLLEGAEHQLSRAHWIDFMQRRCRLNHGMYALRCSAFLPGEFVRYDGRNEGGRKSELLSKHLLASESAACRYSAATLVLEQPGDPPTPAHQIEVAFLSV
jgi:hypothetical protein